jgi:hypothetical protein
LKTSRSFVSRRFDEEVRALEWCCSRQSFASLQICSSLSWCHLPSKLTSSNAWWSFTKENRSIRDGKLAT